MEWEKLKNKQNVYINYYAIIQSSVYYMYMLQVKIKFWLKVFNLGWF